MVAVVRWALLAGLLVVAPAAASSTSTDVDSVRRDISFTVTNPAEGGAERVIHGYTVEPACAAPTVVLLQHGLSYTSEAWDFSPELSYARRLAGAGYAVVAIDRLGYGRSVLENGRNVSTLAYGDMAHQIVVQLRQRYAHVVIGGHSAGAEASELEAGLFGDVDALVAMGYHQFPSVQIVADFFTGDYPRAVLDDYEYFLGTPEHRAEMFYTSAADPAVVARDNATAQLTPSGEVFTIGPQPSRAAAPLVSVPVFLQLADSDRLFEVSYADLAAALFAGAPSVTVDVVPQAGHTYMLHPTGPAAADRIIAWLESLESTPACVVPTAAPAPVVAGAVAERPAPAPAPAPSPATGGGLPATGGSGPSTALAAALLALCGFVRALRRQIRTNP